MKTRNGNTARRRAPRAVGAILLLAALIAPHTASPSLASPQAAASAWSKISGVGAAPVAALALEPGASTRVYAGAYGTGLWVSPDAGATWTHPLTASVAALCVPPGGGGTAYAGAWTEGAFRSTNHGATWVPIVTGLAANDVYALEVDPASPGTPYAGTEIGIFTSTDGGAHWQPSTGSPAGKIEALAFAGTVAVAGGDGGAWRSTGGGAWQAADTGLGGGAVYALVAAAGTLYVGTENGVFVSTDGAQHWQPGPGGLPVGAVRALAAEATGRAVIAGTDQGVFVSERGQAWQAAGEGLSGWALRIGALALDTSHGTWQIYAGTADGLWRLDYLSLAQRTHRLWLPLVRSGG